MQITVVDDCSTSFETQKWLQENGYFQRVEFYQNKKNLGIGGAWNQCIEQSRGEWVHILHQDDVLEDGFYKITNHPLVIENYEKIGFVLTRNSYLTDKGLKKTFSVRLKDEVNLDDKFYLNMHNIDLQCPGVLVPKNVYENVGYFREDLYYSLDREMWTRIASRYMIVYNPEPLCSFRIHLDSQSARLSKLNKNIIEYANSIDIICNNLPIYIRQKTKYEMKKSMTKNLINLCRKLPLNMKKELCILIWQKGYKLGVLKALIP